MFPQLVAAHTFPLSSTLNNVAVNTGVSTVTVADMQKMQDAGVKYVRFDLTWKSIENENGPQGNYNWGWADTMVNNLTAHGLKPIFILAYGNSLYSDGDGNTMDDPGEWQGFANYAAAAVARYDAPGVIWEIWNEQNTHKFWQVESEDDNSPQSARERADNYMGLINTAVPAMRNASPNANIVSGGLLNIAWNVSQAWFDEAFSQGLLTKVDGIGVHLYGDSTGMFPERTRNEIANLRVLMGQHGAPADFPILNTEYGSVTSDYAGSSLEQETEQAAVYLRMYFLNMLDGLRTSVWYEWRTNTQYSMLKGDGTPKVAYHAVDKMTEQLANYTLESQLDVGSRNDFLLVYKNGNQRKLVMWTTGTPHEVVLNTTASPGSLPLAGMTGTPGTVPVSGGKLTVTPTRFPSYVNLGTSSVSVAASSEINIALNAPATASSHVSPNTANKANDGSTDTRWASSYADNQWIYFDLGSSYNINRVVIDWQTAYAKEYRIEVSNNASTWTSIYYKANALGGVEDIRNLVGNGRYLRIFCIDRATGYGNSMWEVRVYSPDVTAPSSVNLAEGRPAVASSVVNSSRLAEYAVDGNAGTRWASAYANNQWIYVDLGQSHDITRVVLNWEAAYASQYRIEVSNNASTWTDITGTINGQGGVEEITGLSGSGRYVRIYCIQRATSYGNSLWEIEVYSDGAPQEMELAEGRPAVASSVVNSSRLAEYAVDGNAGTRWASAYANNQWIYVDLGQSHNITRVVLNWEAAYASQYRIEVSNNASTWTDITGTINGQGGVEEITGLSGSGRYVRIYCIQRATSYGNSLWEIEVYGY